MTNLPLSGEAQKTQGLAHNNLPSRGCMESFRLRRPSLCRRSYLKDSGRAAIFWDYLTNPRVAKATTIKASSGLCDCRF